jgi:excisionase family DNA binding protein
MTDSVSDGVTVTPSPSHVGVTPAEAAAILGISERTVQRRLKRGNLKGYKVDTGRGEVWRVMLDAVTDTPTDRPDAVVVTATPTADVTAPSVAEFAHAIIDELRQEYRDELKRLHRENQQLAGQLGFTQAKLQEAEKTIALLQAPKDEQPAEVEEKPRSWWRRLFGV